MLKKKIRKKIIRSILLLLLNYIDEGNDKNYDICDTLHMRLDALPLGVSDSRLC